MDGRATYLVTTSLDPTTILSPRQTSASILLPIPGGIRQIVVLTCAYSDEHTLRLLRENLSQKPKTTGRHWLRRSPVAESFAG